MSYMLPCAMNGLQHDKCMLHHKYGVKCAVICNCTVQLVTAVVLLLVIYILFGPPGLRCFCAGSRKRPACTPCNCADAPACAHLFIASETLPRRSNDSINNFMMLGSSLYCSPPGWPHLRNPMWLVVLIDARCESLPCALSTCDANCSSAHRHAAEWRAPT